MLNSLENTSGTDLQQKALAAGCMHIRRSYFGADMPSQHFRAHNERWRPDLLLGSAPMLNWRKSIKTAAHISVESTQKSPAKGESNPTKGHRIPDNSKHDAAIKREEDKRVVAATASLPEPPDSDVKIIAKSESQKPPIQTSLQPSQHGSRDHPPATHHQPAPACECSESALEFNSEFLSVCFEEKALWLLAASTEVARALMKYNLFDTDGPDGLCKVLWAELGVECAQDLQFVNDAHVDCLKSSKLIKPTQARKLRGLLREQQAVLEVEMKPEALKAST